MIFLNTSETLARLGGAFPPGHQLLCLAAELAAGVSTGLAERLFAPKGNAAGAVAEFGALGASGGPSLLWLIPGSENGSGCRQLVLGLPAGRYRAEYWNIAEGRLAGVEIATAAPLVLGLPDPRAACAILIVPLF
jgi:hypothetical protein